MEPQILVDMDCVLADFFGAVASHFGFEPNELDAAFVPGEYDVVPVLSRLLEGVGQPPIEEHRFWALLRGKEKFWGDMKPLPWFGNLLADVNWFTDKWEIVSSPSRCPSSYAGKVRWVQSYLGETFPHGRLHLTGNKARFANPRAILIDDSPKNIDAFVAAGGHGVLFPAIHNSRSTQRHNPLPVVFDDLARAVRRVNPDARLPPV